MIEIALTGHLTVEKLEHQLDSIDPQELAKGGARILIDVTSMTGYDSTARDEFVRWHSEQRPRIAKEAIVTSNMLYRMVIPAMAMASRVNMKSFAEREDAVAWLAL